MSNSIGMLWLKREFLQVTLSPRIFALLKCDFVSLLPILEFDSVYEKKARAPAQKNLTETKRKLAGHTNISLTYSFPTDLFTMLEPQNPSIDELYVLPDEPFHNFRALKSVDRRILCSSWTPCDGF